MTDSRGSESDPHAISLEGLLSGAGQGGLQDILERTRASLIASTQEGVAGGGAVRVTVTGERKIVAVHVEPEVFASGDAAMLEELLVAAASDAYDRVETARTSSIGSLLQNLVNDAE
jgi:nucleoid-associated protein EbfC